MCHSAPVQDVSGEKDCLFRVRECTLNQELSGLLVSGQISEDYGTGGVEGVEMPGCGEANAPGGAGYEDCFGLGHCIVVTWRCGWAGLSKYDYSSYRVSKWCDEAGEGMMRRCGVIGY